MVKVGDRIKIIQMTGEAHYEGREGVVETIDSLGQLHGTWGGLAVIPEQDKFVVIKQKEHQQTSICVITGKEIIGDVHDAYPLAKGKCSTEANYTAVVPYRYFLTDIHKSKAMLLNTDDTITLVKPKDKYFSLKELQTYVQGLIEYYPKQIKDCYVICNEEGLLKAMPYNKLAKRILGVDLVGPVIVIPKDLID